MFNMLAGLVAFFYGLIPSYGLAISLLTLAVMVVLAPFTIKGTRSMLAMQRLQPEIKRLQAKHKGDRQALNEAMMAFYKEHQINPLAGCLPLVVQMPVLLVMYRVIRGLTYNRPHYIKHSTKLYQALIQHGHLADAQERGTQDRQDAVPGNRPGKTCQGTARVVRPPAAALPPHRPGGRHRVRAGPPDERQEPPQAAQPTPRRR